MQQLTGLDAAFLALETANATGHVGGVSVLDPRDAPQPLTLARLTDVMADRLPLVPVLRRKLLNVPLGLDQPYWIDDPDFDIEYHIREIALPRPGSDAQLTEQIARLHARPLDRSRPLWEIYLITGLAKRRAAVYTKIHHAAIDGVSGAELLTVLLDLSPAGREVPPSKPFTPGRPPGPATLAALAAARLAWRPVQTVRIANEMVRVLPTLAPAAGSLVGGMLGLNRGDGEVIPTTPGPGPGHAVQPADHAAPPGGVPQRGPGRREGGQEHLRGLGQRRRPGDVRGRAAALARRPRGAARVAADRDDPGVRPGPGQQGRTG